MGKIPKYLGKIPENLCKNGTQWFAEINKDLFLCKSHEKSHHDLCGRKFVGKIRT